MRLRTFYTIAILVPLVALPAVAALGGGPTEPATALPSGVTVGWLFPRSGGPQAGDLRGRRPLVVVERNRRDHETFERVLWRAPAVIAVANFLVPAPFVLVNGIAREMFAEQGGGMALRFLARLLIGFSYVALVGFIREQLMEGEALRESDCSGRAAGAGYSLPPVGRLVYFSVRIHLTMACRSGSGTCGFGGIGAWPQTPDPPFFIFSTSVASTSFPAYLAATSLNDGPTTL